VAIPANGEAPRLKKYGKNKGRLVRGGLRVYRNAFWALAVKLFVS
jgi:hypothetical protein